jgi:hypothetical protein
MRKLIAYLIERFGINTVEKATKKVFKTVDNLQKVVDRQQSKAESLAKLAEMAALKAIAAQKEATRAGKVKANLSNLFVIDDD